MDSWLSPLINLTISLQCQTPPHHYYSSEHSEVMAALSLSKRETRKIQWDYFLFLIPIPILTTTHHQPPTHRIITLSNCILHWSNVKLCQQQDLFSSGLFEMADVGHLNINLCCQAGGLHNLDIFSSARWSGVSLPRCSWRLAVGLVQ